MSSAQSYEAGRIRRTRASKIEMADRFDAIVAIVAEAAPTSVRHVYYRSVVAGLVEKSDNGYAKVQRALVELRRSGRVSYYDIVDSTRWMRKPTTWDSPDAALADLTSSYRRAMWQDLPVVLELWCESESVAGVLAPVWQRLDVACYPIKGQTSDSFCYSAAQEYRHEPRRVELLYVGDYDPAGLEIESQLNSKLVAFSGRDDLTLRRVGITPDQAVGLQSLGTLAKKNTWRDADGVRHFFVGQAIEAEAMPAQEMRDIVTAEIQSLIPEHVARAHTIYETHERAFLATLPQFGGSR